MVVESIPGALLIFNTTVDEILSVRFQHGRIAQIVGRRPNWIAQLVPVGAGVRRDHLPKLLHHGVHAIAPAETGTLFMVERGAVGMRGGQLTVIFPAHYWRSSTTWPAVWASVEATHRDF